MGCGTGEDALWWATLTTRDDPPTPHNYNVLAVDRDESKLSQVPTHPNLRKINKDFTKPNIFPIKIDLMWAHDSLQYSTNPVETLTHWNAQMNVNGMLVLCIPQHSGVEYNQYYSRSHSGCYYHFTPTNLIYMLAINGFDCRDAYLLKEFNDPWIHMAVYKSDTQPMDPATTSWMDLVDKKLLHPTVEASIVKHGYLRQEDIMYPWLDRENYFIDYISQYTEIPKEAGEPTVTGIFNTTEASANPKLEQAPLTIKETKLAKAVGVIRPPKKTYD